MRSKGEESRGDVILGAVVEDSNLHSTLFITFIIIIIIIITIYYYYIYDYIYDRTAYEMRIKIEKSGDDEQNNEDDIHSER